MLFYQFSFVGVCFSKERFIFYSGKVKKELILIWVLMRLLFGVLYDGNDVDLIKSVFLK